MITDLMDINHEKYEFAIFTSDSQGDNADLILNPKTHPDNADKFHVLRFSEEDLRSLYRLVGDAIRTIEYHKNLHNYPEESVEEVA